LAIFTSGKGWAKKNPAPDIKRGAGRGYSLNSIRRASAGGCAIIPVGPAVSGPGYSIVLQG
jgi:hypothetical protein